MTPVQLPEVPAHSYGFDPNQRESEDAFRWRPTASHPERLYTAAQIREYATEDRANVLAAILAIIPGGSICDPQQIADDIRALLTPSETNSER